MLFRPGRGVLYRANPLTKLAALLPVLAALPVAPAWVLAGIGALCLGIAAQAGIARPVLRRSLLLLVPVALALVAIHGFLLPHGPAQPLGGLTFYPQGLDRAALFLARLTALVPAALLLVMTTPVADLADALEQGGMPAAPAYLLTAPLALAETLAADAEVLRDALQLRGVTVRGNPLRQLLALARIVTPLVRGQLIEAGPRARALELRGFGALPRRSLLQPPADSPRQRLLRRLALAVAALVLLAGSGAGFLAG